MTLEYTQREKLVQILSSEALVAPGSPQDFFRNLLRQANLSKPFLMQAIGLPKGNDLEADARAIIDWSDRGGNPQDPRFTVLGSILTPLLATLGLEDASFVVALIVHCQLYRDAELLGNLTKTYQVPLLATAPQTGPVSSGPDFIWEDGEDYTELQGLLQQRQVMFLDVGFLQKAIQQASTVCRIELPSDQDPKKRRCIGTGFLVSRDKVLTNYHVLAPNQDSDVNAYVDRLELNFGRFSTAEMATDSTQRIKLAEQPIVKSSVTDCLDYALLKVEGLIRTAGQLSAVDINSEYPAADTGLNMLQHPGGDAMKLAISPYGITRVLKDKGLLHYMSDTLGGSSGSPCYNDDWQVIALHHAEKSGPTRVYREGILMQEIYPEIEDFLG